MKLREPRPRPLRPCPPLHPSHSPLPIAPSHFTRCRYIRPYVVLATVNVYLFHNISPPGLCWLFPPMWITVSLSASCAEPVRSSSVGHWCRVHSASAPCGGGSTYFQIMRDLARLCNWRVQPSWEKRRLGPTPYTFSRFVSALPCFLTGPCFDSHSTSKPSDFCLRAITIDRRIARMGWSLRD